MRLNTCAFISTVVLSVYPTSRAQIGATCAPPSSCVYLLLLQQQQSHLNCKPQYRVYQYTGTDTTLPTPQQSMPSKKFPTTQSQTNSMCRPNDRRNRSPRRRRSNISSIARLPLRPLATHCCCNCSTNRPCST
jgi:hypothetical protein